MSGLAEAFGAQWSRVVAILRADLGSLDRAEEAAAQAFAAAAARWPTDGIPEAPLGWLVTVARRWAIDQARRDRRFEDRVEALRRQLELPQRQRGLLTDDLLAMIFGCCHRALDEPARIALTLRYVVGLSTVDIARSFLVPEATMAKRLVRAKKKIAATQLPFVVPEPEHLAESLDAVLRVIYLIFTQGHAAPIGELVRGDLCDEARWLVGQLGEALGEEPEVWGLASLLAYTDSRREARVDADGEIVLLADQDRGLWDRQAIAEGRRLLGIALAKRRIGSYQLQAAIAGAHAAAPIYSDTDWNTIRRLYAMLARLDPSPVVRLNEAVAVSLAEGAPAGLAWLEPLDDALEGYHYFHAVRADLLARCGRADEAQQAVAQALATCSNEAERRSIRRRAARWTEPVLD
ncbi:MAG: RNA polymerase sigma factor [Propioniciclava sp.]